MYFSPFSIEEVYKKDANLKKDDVKTILDHLKTQKHLPELTEFQVILFLHSCHYRIETAKKTIDAYFTTRTLYPYIFECAAEEVIRKAFSYSFMRVLPEKTEDGDILMAMKILDGRIRNYDCIEHVKVSIMVLALYLHQYGPANGFILILDSESLGLGHLFKMNLGALKIAFKYFQEALPVRIKEIHYINVNRITEKFVNLTKCFLNKEVSKMINCHTSLESLYKFVPKKCLPEDYGGTLPPIMSLHEECLQNVIDNLDFFKWHDSQKVDEKKRFTKNKSLIEKIK